MKYAQVIVDNRASVLDRPFTYKVGPLFEDILKEGMRVIVPFGNGNKPIKGFVIGIQDDFTCNYKLKEIIDILDDKPLISKELIQLGLWIKDEYLSPYLDAFQPILPPGDYKEINTFVELTKEELKKLKLSNDEKKIIDYLSLNSPILLSKLKEDLKINNINPILNKLEENGIIEINIDIRTTITKKTEKWAKLNPNYSIDEILKIIGNRARKQIEIVNYLNLKGGTQCTSLIEELNISLSTLRALEKRKVVNIYDKEVKREAVKRLIPYYEKHTLTNEQYNAFESILKYSDMSFRLEPRVMEKSPHSTTQKGGEIIGQARKPAPRMTSSNKFLIHGVTGSGKTEIYLQLVEEMLKKGKDTIILVPEISLTPQTIDRFMGRFGEKVAVIHSKLSSGERFDQWRSIKTGKVKLVVGARSAIFAPFKNLGLIIIDEEHENTYKSSQNPKYDTIDVAGKRCELENAILVLGTATPSIETYYKAQKGEYKLLELKQRANKQELPEVILVDMREELNSGNKSIFSRALYNEIKDNLEIKKQTILFLNRRGFSTFVSCRNCGYVAKCNNCDISMTYHRNIDKLRCHYCGVTKDTPNVCPSCGSKYIKYFGIGTEQVEESTKELFPNANIVRMDSDTTSAKGSYEDMLEEMKAGKIDILIGTQMISKGLDFPNVTLVGIIAADTTLNLPDFRSPEKAFQLVTQVAGRAGRGDVLGKVVLQTYNPEHYSIEFAKLQDYNNFYKTEVMLRKEFLYPPFINIISILVYGEDIYNVRDVINNCFDIIKKESFFITDFKNRVNGPNPAPLEKIKNNYRWQIILKVEDNHMEYMKDIIKRVCILNEYNLKIDNVKFSIDINPLTIL